MNAHLAVLFMTLISFTSSFSYAEKTPREPSSSDSQSSESLESLTAKQTEVLKQIESLNKNLSCKKKSDCVALKLAPRPAVAQKDSLSPRNLAPTLRNLRA